MALYQYFSRDSATAKPSSQTAKEKEVVEKFVNTVENRGVVVVAHTTNILPRKELRSVNMPAKTVQPKLVGTSPVLPEDRFPKAQPES